jgi:SAM-dependent methyltransferase
LKNDPQVVIDPRSYWKVVPHAEHYERGRFSDPWGRIYRVAEERAIRRALRPLARSGRVLDVACGTGRVTRLLVREGFAEVVGSDVSNAMMAVAKRQLPNVEFFQGDATRLPFDDHSFDLVTCVGLLMHLDAATRVGVLRELARISRRPVVVQYGCVGTFLRLTSWLTRRPAGGVRYPVADGEMRQDLERSGLREQARFWTLRPVSSSVILSLTT